MIRKTEFHVVAESYDEAEADECIYEAGSMQQAQLWAVDNGLCKCCYYVMMVELLKDGDIHVTDFDLEGRLLTDQIL